jgi:hypothetical protein
MKKIFLAVALAMGGLFMASTPISAADVNLSWAYRGGSCYIDYTEANQSMYKYKTVTNCDSGSITIGGLMAGTQYKFKVNQENNVNSSMVYATASGTQSMAAAPVSTMAAPSHKKSVREELPAKINLKSDSGPMTGEVMLHWSDNHYSNGQYHLVYGTESGNYTMGALNVGGDGMNYTVKGLVSGKKYFFKLIPIDPIDGQPRDSSWEVSNIAR